MIKLFWYLRNLFSLKTFSGSLHVKKCVNEIEGAEREERERERTFSTGTAKIMKKRQIQKSKIETKKQRARQTDRHRYTAAHTDA
jgi:hypothetical protein